MDSLFPVHLLCDNGQVAGKRSRWVTPDELFQVTFGDSELKQRERCHHSDSNYPVWGIWLTFLWILQSDNSPSLWGELSRVTPS